MRDEETDEDLQLIFAPGSSLGGARPKASVIDQHGHLSIAKFPKETDDYSMETWEEIALRLASQAGIETPQHELIEVAGKAVMLSRRFDRDGVICIPFLSAMEMMGAKDGERGSYPDIVDALARHGAQGKTDAHALYRRVAFNVLISNVDDHLRNHGFLWRGKTGWSLSPAYDLNPVPADLKARVLTINIDLDEGTCSLDLLEAASEYFALTLRQARAIINEVATTTATWRNTAKAVGARTQPRSRARPAPSNTTISSRHWRYDKNIPLRDRSSLGSGYGRAPESSPTKPRLAGCGGAQGIQLRSSTPARLSAAQHTDPACSGGPVFEIPAQQSPPADTS